MDIITVEVRWIIYAAVRSWILAHGVYILPISYYSYSSESFLPRRKVKRSICSSA